MDPYPHLMDQILGNTLPHFCKEINAALLFLAKLHLTSVDTFSVKYQAPGFSQIVSCSKRSYIVYSAQQIQLLTIKAFARL